MKLNPSTQHADYVTYSPKWDKCDDVIAGEDAVHAAGVKYLRKRDGQSNDDYKSYVEAATFYNATARTIDGLVGMLFRKEPTVILPASLDAIKADITLTNCDLNEFAENVSREVLSTGRIGVLVEYPSVNMQGMTEAQASALNLRPYATTYDADDILNWKVQRINNVMQPVMIALEEEVTNWADEFSSSEKEQIRALLLIDSIYLQRIYQKNDKKEWVQIGDDIVPLMNGKPLNYIPFVFFGANSNTAEVSMPPLYDLVTLNISHYRTTASLERGCDFTGAPTAVVSGYQAATNAAGVTEKLSIGSSTAWIFPDPNAKASYLEFTGQGLGALENRLKVKEDGMAALGARMLAAEKAGVEAKGTVKLRHSGENAVLSSIANLVSAGLTRVLSIMAQWSGVSGEVKIEINKDFTDNGLTAQELTALVASYQAGTMSFDTLYWNMQQGEVAKSDRTAEQEQDLISSQAPALGTIGGA